ncbi:MAG TPA: S-methyl-5'-thioadenosine phosphorylase [Persephonella sp.]|uniref:Probable 6-oxopurine nucleoside phosphorylase n=1 Tax=Persephonella marina (strain DSM 14350 / EX-H1) TaxID=123214 RepID=C0QPX3_PERMH|nr:MULTISPECIES: S-methyl-5'-thioadenosine phosphorylase [Persephonella]ACO03922.1 methylthioadenosine phosphorylase [Persephonella marina EX-H1]HCB69666.1 S-methyl-5'-thioadenosine phosphorylase [Persephonella sp.]
MLGVIGGSGLYQVDDINILDEVNISTPYGEPSDRYIIAEYRGKKAVFLPRHGKGHKYPPHLINYRANIWGFRKLGVDRILSVSAVGGINPLLKPGDFVLSDQFIDFTKVRPVTFYEGVYTIYDETDGKDDLVSEYLKNNRVVHIDVTDPFCSSMRKTLSDILDEKGYRYHKKGTYIATEGPRLETSAEIKAFSILGADIVGMTLVPEIVLARELSMHFASINVVTNLAAGISGERLTSDEVIQMMKEKNDQIKEIILSFIEKVPEKPDCNCEDVLDGAAI